MRSPGFAYHPAFPSPSHHRWTYPACGVCLAFVLTLIVTTMHRMGLSVLTLGSSLFVAVAALVLCAYSLGRQVDRLECMSLTDPATGLKNRHLLDRYLRDETARAVRCRLPLTLLVIDVDHLKAINDAHGHQEGDAALRIVAESLASACRHTDVAARYGGDEFVVLAPMTTAQQGMEIAERIRCVLRRTAGERASAPTVSIGVADLETANTVHANVLFAAADRALYRAKRSGRDRVVLAGSTPDGARGWIQTAETPVLPKGNVRWLS